MENKTGGNSGLGEEALIERGEIGFTGLVEVNALPGESSFNHEKSGSHFTGAVHLRALAAVAISAYEII